MCGHTTITSSSSHPNSVQTDGFNTEPQLWLTYIRKHTLDHMCMHQCVSETHKIIFKHTHLDICQEYVE